MAPGTPAAPLEREGGWGRRGARANPGGTGLGGLPCPGVLVQGGGAARSPLPTAVPCGCVCPPQWCGPRAPRAGGAGSSRWGSPRHPSSSRGRDLRGAAAWSPRGRIPGAGSAGRTRPVSRTLRSRDGGGLRAHPRTPPGGRRLQEAGPPGSVPRPASAFSEQRRLKQRRGRPWGPVPRTPGPTGPRAAAGAWGRGRTPGSPSGLGGERRRRRRRGGCGVGEGGRGLRSQSPAQAGCGWGVQRGRPPRGGAVRDVPRAADPRTGSGDCRNAARTVPRVPFSGGTGSPGRSRCFVPVSLPVCQCPFPCPGACPYVPSLVPKLGTSWQPPPPFKQGPRGRGPRSPPSFPCT